MADLLLNELQETLLFFHPVVWWLSARMRLEREHCCDDDAVAACGSAATYGRALLALESTRLVPLRLALSASNGLLVRRIRRIVAQAAAPPTKAGRARTSIAALACGLFALGVTLSACSDLVTETAAPAEPLLTRQANGDTARVFRELDVTRSRLFAVDDSLATLIRTTGISYSNAWAMRVMFERPRLELTYLTRLVEATAHAPDPRAVFTPRDEAQIRDLLPRGYIRKLTGRQKVMGSPFEQGSAAVGCLHADTPRSPDRHSL